jgi:2-oxoisovalerate dehydrogenase E1 component alpha subunit
MTVGSRLHVPHPPARPGEAPDFSYLQISPAGAVGRPDITSALTDIEFLSTGMVRVLDETQAAVGPWNPHLEPAELQVGLRHMLLTRILHPLPGRGGRLGGADHGAASR